MQMNTAMTHTSFSVQAPETSFNSVWGNEMQREDFLALAAGVRQLSADLALPGSHGASALESAHRAAE